MKTRLLLSSLLTLACCARLSAQAPAMPPASGPGMPAAGPASSEAATPAAETRRARPAPAAEASKPEQPAVAVEGSAPVKGTVTRDQDKISVDFPDEDIKAVLRNVADISDLNLVIPDSLAGKTTIKLRDVTWRQIFQVVLAPVGHTYVEEGNIIKIVSNESLLDEPVTTEVIILNSAKASDISPVVSGMVDGTKGGKLQIDARSNALVITERPTRLTRIRSTIEKLDKAIDQVMIESKFVEVFDSDIRNIGVNWASLNAYRLGVGGINQTFDRSRGQNESSGSSRNNSTGTSSNNGTDRSTNNTTNSGTNNNSNTSNTGATSTSSTTGAIATSNTTTSNGDLLTFDPLTGVPTVTTIPPITNTTTTSSLPSTTSTTTTPSTSTNSSSGTNGSTGSSVSDVISSGLANTASNAINSLTSLANTGGTSRFSSAVFSASDFNIVLSALKTLNKTKVVSNPTIVTLNNTKATINVGEEDPIPKYAFNAQTGTYEVTGFEVMKIGVILEVTPQVNARGVITMQLAPEVSQKAGTLNFGSAQIPIKATRKVTTTVSLKDGYTMGIGGLLTASRDHGGNKVPLLGSLPLLGRLFSTKNVNDNSTNLLIFITARTVSADGASPEEVFDPRAIQSAEMTREDLPGNRAAKGTDIFAQPTKK